MTFFGLQYGQDLENQAAHPHQEFREVPPPENGLNIFFRFCIESVGGGGGEKVTLLFST